MKLVEKLARQYAETAPGWQDYYYNESDVSAGFIAGFEAAKKEVIALFKDEYLKNSRRLGKTSLRDMLFIDWTMIIEALGDEEVDE